MPRDTLHLHLFGGFSARMDRSRKALSFSRRKGAALVAVLATPAGRSRTREELADLLWSRTGEEGARNNLRQNLYHIRSLLPDFPGLIVTAQSLQLNLSSSASILPTLKQRLAASPSPPWSARPRYIPAISCMASVSANSLSRNGEPEKRPVCWILPCRYSSACWWNTRLRAGMRTQSP
jgi:hypothetical protein